MRFGALPPLPIVGAAAASAHGPTWRGLSAALLDGRVAPRPPRALPDAPAGLLVSEAATPPPAEDPTDPKARKLMTRAGHLAVMAAHHAVAEAGWDAERAGTGNFLGIGASGGPLEELGAMVRASVEDCRISLGRFATSGLGATNPLFAFHLLNNFNLCHGAIGEGLRGPNAAFFSRGSGTALALVEAVHALRRGECERALAGGADSALHPGTLIELARDGLLDDGLVPGEGAALLALSVRAERPLGLIEGCAVRRARRAPIEEELAQLARELGAEPADAAVVAGWNPTVGATLTEGARGLFGARVVVDLGAGLGESLAASPALAWVAALDLLASGAARVAALSAGPDGDLCGVVLTRRARA
jgi:hypothetical protein